MMKIVAALGAVAVLVGAGAWAHGRAGRNMQQMITKRVAALEDAIQATPQQRGQIEQSRDTILNALQARRQNGQQQTHQKLMQLLTADKLNPDDLYAIADQHAQAMQDMAKVIVAEIVKVHDILTPAQRQMLAQKAQEMRQHHQQHQGGFGGPGE